MIQSDYCMSDFNLDKTVIIIHHYNTLSRLDTMARVLLRKVLLLLGDEVYENRRPLYGSFGHDHTGV